MERRSALKSILAVGLTSSAGLAAWHSVSPSDKLLSIKQVLVDLDKLKKSATSLSSTSLSSTSVPGTWTMAQTLIHCAQSIEYSLTGFPEHRSPLFKNSVGKLAFSAFYAKGKMTHPLDEAIPGAPVLDANTNLELAFNRFEKALADFDTFNGELAPHFAYGALSKHEYEVAHVMHFNNHFQTILQNT